MRQISWLLLTLCACAEGCSGDDAHRQPTIKSHPAPPIIAPDAGAAAATPPTTPATPAPLAEAMAAPYFTSGPAGDGARAFALEKWKDALAGFGKAHAAAKRDPGATPEDVARLDLMLGLTYARLSDWPKAAAHLLAAQPALPLLADFVRYHGARALYFAHDTKKARAMAEQVARDSIHGADAELLVGDILRGSGAAAKIHAHYRDYLARRPDGPRRSEVRFRIAETAPAPADAAAMFRQILIDDPLSSWATKATDKLTALAPSLPVELRAYDQLTAAEHIARGKVLFDAMRNPESEAAFAAALADATISVADRCVAAYHQGQSRFKARDRKGAAPMFDAAAAACKAAKNTDLEIKSLYQGGRSYAFIGQHDVATKRYQAAQVVDPSHSYSDDALLREGEEWWSRGDKKQLEKVLASLPVKFPKGDNVAEAMWRLGWQAWRDKDHDAAIKWWKKQIELVPHDDNYFGEGQAQYWLGRAYAVKGKTKDALATWEAGVRKYPAAYYALLGLNRIRETDAKRYAALVAELAADPAGYDPSAPAFTFTPRVEWGQPGFLRALELLRLGLGATAEAELRKAGLAAPKHKLRVDDPEQIEKLWAMSFLFDRAGRYESAHWPTRWHIVDYRRSWPTGANRARWRIAYPRAYEELLARHAATNKVPFAMQIAIVREESAFDPLLESYANAVGLTQMIRVTADRFAKGTGITPTRENLRDPEMNVTIGSRFLGFLFANWNNFALLVPPSYNGGEGYVKRNLKTRGTWDADEFVEGILDDQIRNYTKRVTGTYFTYAWLYEGKVPEIPNTFPAALLPKP